MKKLLKKHGFKQSIFPNKLTKDKRYEAVIWHDGKTVTINEYSLNDGNCLNSNTYSSKSSLESELKENQWLFYLIIS